MGASYCYSELQRVTYIYVLEHSFVQNIKCMAIYCLLGNYADDNDKMTTNVCISMLTVSIPTLN